MRNDTPSTTLSEDERLRDTYVNMLCRTVKRPSVQYRKELAEQPVRLAVLEAYETAYIALRFANLFASDASNFTRLEELFEAPMRALLKEMLPSLNPIALINDFKKSLEEKLQGIKLSAFSNISNHPRDPY